MRYNRIDQRFWTDRAVRGWTDDAKLLALYLLTSPHRATEGLFRLPKAYIQADLEWSAERLGQPFRQLLESRFLDYDDDAQVVLIRNALKYQPLQNDNQVTAALKALEELPPTRLAWDLRQLAEQFCQRLAKRLPEGFGEPPTPSPAPTPTPEDPYVEPEPKPSPAVASPPARPRTVERVVFEAWQEATGKHRAKLDDKRRRVIQRALAAFPLEDVLDAVRGWQFDTWTERPRFNDLGQLLKDADHIEKLRDLWRAGPQAVPGRNAQRSIGTYQQMKAYGQQREGGGRDDVGRVDGHGAGGTERLLPRPG